MMTGCVLDDMRGWLLCGPLPAAVLWQSDSPTRPCVRRNVCQLCIHLCPSKTQRRRLRLVPRCRGRSVTLVKVALTWQAPCADLHPASGVRQRAAAGHAHHSVCLWHVHRRPVHHPVRGAPPLIPTMNWILSLLTTIQCYAFVPVYTIAIQKEVPHCRICCCSR